MKVKKALQEIIRVVGEEADRNPEFCRRLEEALGFEARAAKSSPPHRANRRAQSALDPIDLARQGTPTLRSALAQLSIEQLKDVVAEFGMDPGKLVMKWKTPDRIIDHIVGIAVGRVEKGESFLA